MVGAFPDRLAPRGRGAPARSLPGQSTVTRVGRLPRVLRPLVIGVLLLATAVFAFVGKLIYDAHVETTRFRDNVAFYTTQLGIELFGLEAALSRASDLDEARLHLEIVASRLDGFRRGETGAHVARAVEAHEPLAAIAATVAEVERALNTRVDPDRETVQRLATALDRLRPAMMSLSRAMIRHHTAELAERSRQHRDDLYVALALLGVCTLCMGLLVVALVALNARQRGLARHLEALVDERTCALRGARDEALRASQAKSRFLAQMSHELRTPLNSVIGFSEVIQQEIFGRVESERYRAYVANIHGSATLLLSFVNDLLDIGRIESGELKLRAEPIALGSMISDVVEAQAPRREGICAIRTDLPADLPRVMAEPKALRRMLGNLLNNAIKFTPLPGEIRVRAAIQDGGAVAVEIADDGPGIPPDRLARLVRPLLARDDDPYVRSSTCGLGLGIASALAEALGVGFAVESHDGGGTTVRLTLPVAA